MIIKNEIKTCVYFWIVAWISSSFNVLFTSSVNSAGYELFASLLELEILWQNEIEVIKVMERVVERWKDSPKVFKL